MGNDYDDLVAETFADRPQLARSWERNAISRKTAIALAKLRIDSGLTQRQLADRAGWKQSFVARLESQFDQMPSPETLSRFAAACDAEAGLIFLRRKATGNQVEIASALPLTEHSTAVECITVIAQKDQPAVDEQFEKDVAVVAETVA